MDYVSNTLYPRQIHVYEGFEEATKEEAGPGTDLTIQEEAPKPKEAVKGAFLKKEEEEIFQEVLSDFLGSST